MIPTTLEECFPALDDMLGFEDREFLFSGDPEKQVVFLHHSLGQDLRNKWNSGTNLTWP
jgi:hypothetical protein